MDAEVAKAAQRLLGNMALLKANKNRDIANKPFAEKRVAFAESGYFTTNEIAKYERWTIEEIRDRQLGLAKLAAKTWPLTFWE